MIAGSISRWFILIKFYAYFYLFRHPHYAYRNISLCPSFLMVDVSSITSGLPKHIGSINEVRYSSHFRMSFWNLLPIIIINAFILSVFNPLDCFDLQDFAAIMYLNVYLPICRFANIFLLFALHICIVFVFASASGCWSKIKYFVTKVVLCWTERFCFCQ